jgi:hypothetical protein
VGFGVAIDTLSGICVPFLIYLRKGNSDPHVTSQEENVQQDPDIPDNKRPEARDIPEDILAYCRAHQLHFDEHLWSPVVQQMIRLRMQLEKRGKLPDRKQGAQATDIHWRHWQE